jgi:hypothetical protein
MTFATNLETVAPGETIAQTVTLPPDRAPGWLAHALTYHGWEAREEAALTAGEGGCLAGIYQESGRALRVELCPAAGGSELTLSGDGG